MVTDVVWMALMVLRWYSLMLMKLLEWQIIKAPLNEPHYSLIINTVSPPIPHRSSSSSPIIIIIINGYNGVPE
jgi:hypothetical protein